MSGGDPTLVAARATRDAARVRMMATLDEAKERLSPSSLAGNAVDGIKDKASALAGDGVAVVRERPFVAVAAAGAAGLLLARRPLLAWIASLRHDRAT